MHQDERARLVRRLDLRPAAITSTIADVQRQLGKHFPADYAEFLNFSDGAEGFIETAAYVMLWAVEELAPLNLAYEVEEYMPGLVLFGSDGGGEAYGFDTRIEGWSIVQVPFVGMGWGLARVVADSFDQFLRGPSFAAALRPEYWRFDHGKAGKELFEIKPIILGGDPTDPANKVLLSRDEHMKAVAYWNRVIKDLRSRAKS